MKRVATVSVLILILTALAAASDQPTALLNFVVIRDYNGKPIRNASVVLHPVKKDGKQSKGGLQLKADAEGKASYDGVPYGKLRIQVLAQGFQTFGEDYDIDAPVKEITIKMKRPQGQYSVYEDHAGDKDLSDKDKNKDDKVTDKDKADTPPPDAKPQQ